MADSHIRTVTSKDIDSLKDIMIAYIVDFYKSKRPVVGKVEGHIQHLLENPNAGKQFVIESDGKLAGFATLYFSFSTTRVQKIAVLNDLFIDSEFRGTGLGEELFKFALEYTKEEGFAYMSWETASDNKPAQALYEKMGGKNTNSEWIHYEIVHK